MKKILLGVALAPVFACLFGGAAIAEDIYKGNDGFTYVTGLSSGFRYRINNSSGTGKAIAATANACGMIKLSAAKFSGSSGATVLNVDGTVMISVASLPTKKSPLCKNGVPYVATTPNYYWRLGIGEDGALYGWGLWSNTSYQVRNLSSAKKRVVKAGKCGMVRLSFSQAYPLTINDTVEVVEPAAGSVSIANLPVVNSKVTCTNGNLSPKPTPARFKTVSPSGAFSVYLTGYQPEQKVILSYPSIFQAITVNSNSCGMIRVARSSRFSFKIGDNITVLAPDGGTHALNIYTLTDNRPLCQNGNFYLPEWNIWLD